MYHSIVKGNLLRSFAALNRGDYGVITRQFRKEGVSHWFSGEGHPLAGLRTDIGHIHQWYERLARLMPDLAFDIEKVAISGWPWRTTAILTWTDRLTDRAGRPYQNRGVHVITIRWGRVTGLEVYCDTAYLQGYFEALKGQGVTEAGEEPIIS